MCLNVMHGHNREQTAKYGVCCCQQLRPRKLLLVVEAHVGDADLCNGHACEMV